MNELNTCFHDNKTHSNTSIQLNVVFFFFHFRCSRVCIEFHPFKYNKRFTRNNQSLIFSIGRNGFTQTHSKIPTPYIDIFSHIILTIDSIEPSAWTTTTTKLWNSDVKRKKKKSYLWHIHLCIEHRRIQ